MNNNIMKGKAALDATEEWLSRLTPVQREYYNASVEAIRQAKEAASTNGRNFRINKSDMNAAYRMAQGGRSLYSSEIQQIVNNTTGRVARGLQDASDLRTFRASHGSLLRPSTWLEVLRDRNTAIGAGLMGLAGLTGYGIANLQDNLENQQFSIDEGEDEKQKAIQEYLNTTGTY